MTENDRLLSAALGRVPSGMYILTARHGELETGMLTSWVQQCAFEPPHVSVVIKRGRPITAWLEPGSWFTLNILDHDETDMIAHFGRGFGLDEPAFDGLDLERSESAGPVLREAHAFLECEIQSRHPVGDHELIIARVGRGRILNEGQPMVHVRKSGHHY